MLFKVVPLTNNVIIQLNEITSMVTDKNSLKSEDENFIKNVFKKILEQGEIYNVEEIESWFKNEGSWKNRNIITRITNMSHYIQQKYEQTNKFNILNDEHSCSCD
jgi:hypothetical protein